MKQGDFTNLGEKYRKFRAGYSIDVLRLIVFHTAIRNRPDAVFVDVGAGTGIWTRQVQLEVPHLTVIAIEPGDDMRKNGEIYTHDLPITWKNGSGENTTLSSNSADWISMASSFHWTDSDIALKEFHRVLKPRGYLTLIWNPLLKEGDPVQEKVESLIKKIVPEFSRGSREKDTFGELLTKSGYFTNVIEIRTVSYLRRSVDEYIETWKAVNQLQAVAGPERFNLFLAELHNMLKDMDYIDVPYLTKSWTAQRIE